MKIAFLILAHKNPKQLGDLVRRLDSSSSLFFIHIDVKVDITPFEKEIEKLQNVFWVKREDGRWGEFGIVKATINALIKAQDFSNDISHYILLSGQDYPLKNINEIVQFFKKNEKTSFIEHTPLPIQRLNYSGYDRIKAYSISFYNKRHTAIPLSWKPKFNLKGRLLNYFLLLFFLPKGKRKHPKGIKPFYGSQWWILSNEAARCTIDVINNRPDLLAFHKFTLIPDEIFFQSIIGSIQDDLSGDQTVLNKNLHYIDWQLNESHPKTLNKQDFKKVTSSGKFFARKLETPESDTLIQKLNEEY